MTNAIGRRPGLLGWLGLVALCGCATTGAAGQESVKDIAFPRGLTRVSDLPPPWKSGVASGFVVMKPGESPAAFSELAGEVTLRPSAGMDQVINSAPPVGAGGATCPAANGKLELRPSPATRGRASYEYRVTGCAGVPDFVQLGEIITGRNTIWHFFYIAKGTVVPPERAAEVTRDFAAIGFVP